jgi:hypothetical protein
MISAILILSVEFKKMLTENPSFPVLSVGKVKELIEKGAN